MCGLIGFLAAQPAGSEADSAEVRTAVETALAQMRHRGPDDGGTWFDETAVIGFRRLSLIDWEHSHQPLPYLEDRYHLIFNGEIYNYLELRAQLTEEFGASFATQGDGEAIVAGYHYLGEKIVEHLRGMFAFLIWDSQEQVMFGARDWFGIKPLYTYTDERGSFFASEKKALLSVAAPEVSQQVNTEALQHYLTLQYVPEPASMHTAITRIDSGTSFTLRPGQPIRTKRYFRPDFVARAVPEPDKLYREIADTLRDSVAKHLRSDFTVGAFLSGGIDSTAIAALAREHNPKLLTFTTGFERAGFSEIDVAAESAEAIGVRHITKVVTPQEMMDTLPLIVWYLDDPVADPALVPLYFIAREARKHVKVVLSGEGADELFGGYTIYREPISLRHLTAAPDPVRRLLGTLSTRLPEGMRGKDLLRRASIGIEERYYGNARIFRDDELRDGGLLKTYSSAVSYTDVTAEHYAATRHLDDSTRMQYIDLFTWLRGDILVKADKMTMANSLELRVPFLDTEVFRVAAGIPVEQKLTAETT
ncbi:MAG: asparagine synthase (glutamine-hydrolyzing), partial [Jatrophihabitantaceae bacterium]